METCFEWLFGTIMGRTEVANLQNPFSQFTAQLLTKIHINMYKVLLWACVIEHLFPIRVTPPPKLLIYWQHVQMTHFQIKRVIDFTATKNKFTFVFIFFFTCVVFNSLSNGLWSIEMLCRN